MLKKDRDIEHLIVTFKPDDNLAKRTLKFLAQESAASIQGIHHQGRPPSGQKYFLTDFKFHGSREIHDIERTEINDYLPEKLRYAQLDFLMIFFRRLIEAAVELNDEDCRKINADQRKWRDFLGRVGKESLDEFRTDQEIWVELLTWLKSTHGFDLQGMHAALDRDYQGIDQLCRGIGIRIHKVVGRETDQKVQELGCAF